MDRLKSLEIFKTVADKGSFVRAADTLDLSTAVVTRAVQELERLLGVRLLQRSTRRLSLTTDGEDVLERTRSLLESFEALTASSSLGATEIAGEIRISAPASFSSRLAAPLARFTALYPKVRLQLLASDTPPDLVGERIDLALRVARGLPDSLIARRIGEVRMAVYGAPGYLAERGTPKHPDELAGHDCLVYGSTGREGNWPFQHPVTQQPVEPSVRGLLCANNAEALMSAAINGSGLALLPQFLAREAVARGELQQVLNHWPSPPLGMFLAYASRRNQPLRVRKLIDHLVEALGALAHEPEADGSAMRPKETRTARTAAAA
jgi:LysR family transcriptional regulator, regulator for bpeEF and oprC